VGRVIRNRRNESDPVYEIKISDKAISLFFSVLRPRAGRF
jgi:hypothetical protein